MGIPLELFVDPVPEALLCSECGNALQQPVKVCSEEHIVCHDCRADCVGGVPLLCHVRGGCGEDAITTLEESKHLARAVGELQSRCLHHREGCVWTGPYRTSHDHLPTCPLRPTSCTNVDCAQTVPFAELNTHARFECPYRKLTCPRFGKLSEKIKAASQACNLLRQDKGEKHDAVCQYFACSVKDCPTLGTRDTVSSHEDHCRTIHAKLDGLEGEVMCLRDELGDRDEKIDQLRALLDMDFGECDVKERALTACQKELEHALDACQELDTSLDDECTEKWIAEEKVKSLEAKLKELGRDKDDAGKREVNVDCLTASAATSFLTVPKPSGFDDTSTAAPFQQIHNKLTSVFNEITELRDNNTARIARLKRTIDRLRKERDELQEQVEMHERDQETLDMSLSKSEATKKRRLPKFVEVELAEGKALRVSGSEPITPLDGLQRNKSPTASSAPRDDHHSNASSFSSDSPSSATLTSLKRKHVDGEDDDVHSRDDDNFCRIESDRDPLDGSLFLAPPKRVKRNLSSPEL